MTSVAMIGLGRMGGPMAHNVISSDFDVAVFDISASACLPFEETRARIATSPADAARDADVACIVVFDDDQAIDVVTGNNGLLQTLKQGSVIAIHSTISPNTLRFLEQSASERDVHLIDAGISGGEPGAANGTLLTMVGGSSEALSRASAVLASFSKEVLHAGDLGSGLALKLARNATGYICMAAVHEAMQIAAASGVSLEVLQHTIAETGVFEQALSPFLLGGPSPLAPSDPDSMRALLTHLCALAEKDLDQTIALAEEVNERLPVTQATRESFHHVARL